MALHLWKVWVNRRRDAETPAVVPYWATTAVVVALLAGGCSGRSEEPAGQTEDSRASQDEVIERKSELGPVHATVTVAPANPTLGDLITLTLKVEAEPGVAVEMPSFGEALGRFQIVQYVPREQMESGRWVASQEYTLQAPMSGKQRIPPLRVDFVDERQTQQQGQQAQQDAGVAAVGPAGASPDQELLTEEIAIEVASVVPEGAVAAELSGVRGGLDATSGRPLSIRVLHLSIPVFLLLTVGLWLWALQARARRKKRISAYGLAMTRLSKLESRGLPDSEQADAWYVEISSIIRRYLEDRYSLRAPELTTEEFLQVAQRSGALTQLHRELLHGFLMGCDRVKFARYAPPTDESMQALESARNFLQETRMGQEAGIDTSALAGALGGQS